MRQGDGRGVDDGSELGRRGRMISLVIAATGLFWLAGLALGDSLGWSQRTLALVDLAALGAFAWALILSFGLWRARRNNKAPESKD